MIVSIPYGYNAHYTKKNHRIPDRAPQVASVDVSIPEFVDAECVFEVGNGIEFKYDSNPFMTVAGEPARVWRTDGRLFVQRERVERMVELFCNGANAQGNPFNTSGSSGPALPFPDNLEAATGRVETREQIEGKFEIRKWEDNGGVNEAEAIRRRAEELAIIDGWVCVPVSEPVIAVGQLFSSQIPDGSENAIYMIVTEMVAREATDFNGFEGVDQWHGFRRYSIADADAARAYGIAFAHASRLEFRDVAKIDRVDVDAVSYRSETETVGRAARWVASQLGRHLAELPANTGLALRALKEAEIDAGEALATPDMIYSLEQVLECLPEREDPWSNRQHFPRGWWRSEGRIENYSEPERAARIVDIARVMAKTALDLWATREPGAEWVKDTIPIPAFYDGDTLVSQVTSTFEARKIGSAIGIDGIEFVREILDQGGVLAVVSQEKKKALVPMLSSANGFEAGQPIGQGGRPAPWASLAAETFAQQADLAAYAGSDLAL